MASFIWISTFAASVYGAARPQITHPPVVAGLDKRQAIGGSAFWEPTVVDNTLLSYISVPCGSPGTLATSDNFWNCCPSSTCNPGYYPTSCNAGTLFWGSTSEECFTGTSSKFTNCGTETLYRQLGDSTGYTFYYCQTDGGYLQETAFMIEPATAIIPAASGAALVAGYYGLTAAPSQTSTSLTSFQLPASTSSSPSSSGSHSTSTSGSSGAVASSASSASASATPTSSPSSSTNVGAIAGGTVGGFFGLVIIAAGVLFLFRRKRPQNQGLPSTTAQNVSELPPKKLSELPANTVIAELPDKTDRPAAELPT